MKSIIIIALLLCVYSCKNEPKEVQVTNQEETIKVTVPLEKGCYGFSNENSSIRFQIVLATDKTIEGNLYYALAEKDANNGSFKGNFFGDTLLGKYTFSSEGTLSVREVSFLLKNKQLIEGFGTMDSTGTKFSNVHELQFSGEMPLTKVLCED